jgi:hypothetical protein
MIIGIIVLAVSIISSLVWLWAGGIDYMQKNHPEYKGEDLFGEGDN